MDDEIKEMFMELFECNKTLQKVFVHGKPVKRPSVVDDTAMTD